MVSVASQPFSSCAMASAAITADCRCSAGYLAISRSIFLRAPGLNMTGSFDICCTVAGVIPLVLFGRSSVDVAEDDVLRPDDRDDVRDHVPAGHLVERGQMDVRWRPQLQAIRLVGAVGDDVDAELALRMLDSRIDFARRHMHAFGEELE